MLINKPVATLVYASTVGSFLKMDEEALAEFFSAKLAGREPTLDRRALSDLLKTLINHNRLLETANIIS